MLATQLTSKDAFWALTGFEPLPWQEHWLNRFCSTAIENGNHDCNVPTGLGKSMLPVMVSVANAFMEKPWRRIVYAVNRRIVASQSYEEMEKVVERLSHPENVENKEQKALLFAFRERYLKNMNLTLDDLKNWEEDEKHNLIDIHLLRGGSNERLERIESPIRPTIIYSTLDQAVSRLLLRGYGIRPKARPIAAGTLAYETCWIIDEAHLATAALSTLQRVRTEIVRSEKGKIIGQPLEIIKTTATPTIKGEIFKPTGPWETRIWNAKKDVAVEIFEKEPKDDEYSKRALDFVSEELNNKQVMRVGVIVNSINLARKIFEYLEKKLAKEAKSARVVLIIGAIRQKERDELMERAAIKELKADVLPTQPIVVVATQTVETGPDYDFDALMSQHAAFDALIQRFGRHNRRGRLEEAHGLIYGSLENSPVYHEAPKVAATLLVPSGQKMSFALCNLAQRKSETEDAVLQKASTPSAMAEPLIGSRIRRLGRTWPQVKNETPVSWYIHGERSGEVSIAWREDLNAHLFLRNGEDDDKEKQTTLKNYVGLFPPYARECVTVSTRAARAFLRNSRKSDISDSNDDDFIDEKAKSQRGCLVVRGDTVFTGYAHDIMAGDVLLVPSSYGWHDEYGFFASTEKHDKKTEEKFVAQENYEHPRRFVTTFTLDNDMLRNEEKETEEAWEKRILKFCLAHLEDNKNWKKIEKAKAYTVAMHPFIERVLVFVATTTYGSFEIEDSGAKKTVFLDEHNTRVGVKAKQFCEILKIPEEEKNAIVESSEYHDIGKVDPFFQHVRLGHKDSKNKKPLAKSNRRGSRTVLEYRHECGSLNALTIVNILIRYLIGTHHGYGRPGFPYRSPAEHETHYEQNGKTYIVSNKQDHDVYGQTWRHDREILQKKYSIWGLAYLEAIMRLADIEASIDENNKKDNAQMELLCVTH